MMAYIPCDFFAPNYPQLVHLSLKTLIAEFKGNSLFCLASLLCSEGTGLLLKMRGWGGKMMRAEGQSV